MQNNQKLLPAVAQSIMDRQALIIAKGEHSNHCHVLIGDVQVNHELSEFYVGPNGCLIRHLKESDWVNGNQVWTGEHLDIPIQPGKYKIVHQMQFDPFTHLKRRVLD